MQATEQSLPVLPLQPDRASFTNFTLFTQRSGQEPRASGQVPGTDQSQVVSGVYMPQFVKRYRELNSVTAFTKCLAPF